MRVISSAGALLLAASAAAQQPAPKPVELRRGMIITKSATAVRRTYDLVGAATLDTAIIVIRGDHIVLDLNGATLRGSDPAADPDRRSGLAIRVEGGTDITIRNGTIHGYRVNILARGTTGLVVADLDVGRSWKPRLYSLKEHESLADWLSFHHNEKGEWLRFGAGIYLDSVNGGEIQRCPRRAGDERAAAGEQRPPVDPRQHLPVQLGARDRPLPEQRQPDPAQPARLQRARLQPRHLLARAGLRGPPLLRAELAQRGGLQLGDARRRRFLPLGGAEHDGHGGGGRERQSPLRQRLQLSRRRTRSRRRSAATSSSRTAPAGATTAFGAATATTRRSSATVSPATGSASRSSTASNNAIVANRFDRDATGIRLWGDKLEPSDWGYPKHRDTESHGTRIEENAFTRLRAGAERGEHARPHDGRERLPGGRHRVRLPGHVGDPSGAERRRCRDRHDGAMRARRWRRCRRSSRRLAPPAAPAARAIPSSALSRRDRSAIIIDEWGPYDWQSPKLWPVDSTHATPLRLAVLGPPGTWKVVTMRGIVGISANSGADERHDHRVAARRLARRLGGDAPVPRRGEAAVRFTYTMFEPAQDWTMRAFAWSDSTDPRAKPAAFAGAAPEHAGDDRARAAPRLRVVSAEDRRAPARALGAGGDDARRRSPPVRTPCGRSATTASAFGWTACS